MEADGITLVQVSNEESGVDDFAVSPVDSAVAFITRNQLFLVDKDGKNPRLVADDSQLPEDKKGTYEHGIIVNPVFSPDGQTLAYGLDGLHLYDLATGEDTHVLENMGNLTRYLNFNPYGRDASAWVASKTGSIIGTRNETGIVHMRRGAHVVSVMTKGGKDKRWTPDNEGTLAVARMSKAVNDYFGG